MEIDQSCFEKFRRIISWVILINFILYGEANAGVALRPGSTVEFATVEQGRTILGTRDSFIQKMSQFDRCVRMQTVDQSTEAEFLAYIKSQVLTWSASEKATVTMALNHFSNVTRDLNLSFPSIFYLVKTTGNEEGNAAYLRGSAIILPQSMINSSSLTAILTHELFHEYLHHNPQLKPSLYGILGFKQCPAIQLPQWILDRRITSPNPSPHNYIIWLQYHEQRLPCLPIFYSKSMEYTGGVLFDYLVSKLLILEETQNGFRIKCLPSGDPEMLDYYNDKTDFFDQIGHNTKYIIHPEEILADNFAMMVLNINAPSPWIISHLRQTINMRSIKPAGLPSNIILYGH